MNWLRTAASAYSNMIVDPQWPRYHVLERNQSYEKRRYHPFTCATYTFSAKAGDEPIISSLWKLVKYTQGGNVNGKILKMCLPIMVKVRPSFTGEQENQYTLILVLDQDNYINSPPLPTIDGVSIYHQGEQIFYAKRFGGFAKEADWKRESTQLLELCKKLPVNRQEVISASYDMPTKLRSRRNEVLVAEMIENTSNKTTIAAC